MSADTSPPRELRTERLVLRPWDPTDAAELAPILESNWDHLGPWIPARVATPVPASELSERLTGFSAEFDAAREWRYAVRLADSDELAGEIDLFPRDATARVQYPQSDRGEIGYWLRSDLTGRGLVTEAVSAMLAAARRLERFSLIEIRCDARNAASAAVPRRLGFGLVAEFEAPVESRLQVWRLALR